VRVDLDHRSVAERFFAPAEKAELHSVGDSELHEWFFLCWTAKEAVTKAHGAGLSLPLDSFEVSARPNDKPRLVWRSNIDLADNWRLETLRPKSDVIGALAVRGDPWRLVSFDRWQPVPGSPAAEVGVRC
jgi:4'-phosphopantetheinyl transferase